MGGKWPVAEFTLQLLAEHAESGAAIEDVDLVAEAHFDAGGVASVAHVLGLWGRRRTAHAPELDPHRLVTARGPDCLGTSWYLPTRECIRQLPRWFTPHCFGSNRVTMMVLQDSTKRRALASATEYEASVPPKLLMNRAKKSRPAVVLPKVPKHHSPQILLDHIFRLHSDGF